MTDVEEIMKCLEAVKNNTSILNIVILDGCSKSIAETAILNLHKSILTLQEIVGKQNSNDPLLFLRSNKTL